MPQLRLAGYREIAKPQKLPRLTTSGGLRGYKQIPPRPKELPEYEYKTIDRVKFSDRLGDIGLFGLWGAAIGLLTPIVVYFADIGPLGITYDSTEQMIVIWGGGGFAAGAVFGMIYSYATKHDYVTENVYLKSNVDRNKKKLAEWYKRKQEVERQNQKLLDEDNRNREEKNEKMDAQWRKENKPIEEWNQKVLREANNKIRAKNAVIREKNKHRGRVEILDLDTDMTDVIWN